MQTYETLKPTTWDCKHHVVFMPKYRRQALYAQWRRDLGPVFRDLAEQKECKVEEGHLMPDQVHMMLSVPPMDAVSSVMGFIKGKSAIHIARVYAVRRRNFVGQHFWARGYWVCRRSARTRRPCVGISKSGRRKINASNNWNWRRSERLTITNNPL